MEKHDFEQWYRTLDTRVKDACAEFYDSIDVDFGMADAGYVAEQIADELRMRRALDARNTRVVMAIQDCLAEWRRSAERAAIRSRDHEDRLLSAVEHMQAGVLCGCAGDIEALFSQSLAEPPSTNAVDPVVSSHPNGPRASEDSSSLATDRGEAGEP